MAPRLTTRWWWLLVVVGLVVFAIPRVRNLLGRGGVFVTQPIAQFGGWLNGLVGHAPLTSDVTDLNRQLHEVQERLHEANNQLSLAQNVAALAAYAQTTHHRIINAVVVAASPDPGIQSLVIGQGSDNGVTSGQAVIDASGALIGKIVTAHQTTSTVLLLEDGQSAISGRIQNEAHSPGVVRGERGLAMNMSFIPKNDQLQAGQTIITAGTESKIPPGILIGTIGTIHQRVGDLFQDVVVTPAGQSQGVQIVGVIIS